MLPSKIANLAGLWLGIVTRRHFTTHVWVDVGTSGDAVTAGGNRHGVDVVYYIINQPSPLVSAERIGRNNLR